ncbi:pyridoxal phosphate-dependent aminotransferase [Alsobacter sp. SYSU M60028]|uniref:aspartate transaminase n=1 Tax=Alsobacter ponti TaxID=2962936 RepID=A0ABT1LJU1_9HYPH|nr:pyridoxal phosphate-dependent aminotransferase [Alsobacter ponti]MCP8941000.1 pyridoxal phosphate-dependent aminotransferase [Alsobacter ponti]
MLRRLRDSATIATTRRARELRAAGRDVLVISGGEPDFDTPEHIKAAAHSALDKGDTKYTPTEGTPALRAAIAAKLARDNGLAVKPENVIVGTGGKQVIFNALMATLGEGDEAVVPRPCWVSYPDIVELAGARPVYVDCGPDQGFKLTAAQLRDAIGPRTRWLILNSPNNPTGAVYSAAELRALADVLLEHPNVMVLTDDIYEYIVFDDAKFATIAQVEPRLAARTLTVNGMSKGYCMTGWRIGYGAGPEWLIRAMAKLQGQTTTSCCSLSQAAAVAALNGPHDFVARNNAAYQRRRDLVVEAVNAVPGLACATPQGAFYVYVDASRLIGARRPDGGVLGDDIEVAAYMLDAAGVAVVPGAGFGYSPWFRLCFAYADDVLRDACSRIARAVSELRLP